MSEREKGRSRNLVSETRKLDGKTVIIGRSDFCELSTILMQGYTLRRIGRETDRSIVGFQATGSFINPHGFAFKRLDHNLSSIGWAAIGIVPHE